jgi:ureidoglycolate lyase
MGAPRRVVALEPLTAEAFRPFGEVIDAQSSAHFTINEGYAERHDDLAQIDVLREGGRPRLSIFRAKPRPWPLALSLLERHPLGSQAFVPMSPLPYLVVVCGGQLAQDAPDLALLRCFFAEPGQGVNYARGTWHHPLLALHEVCDFAVVDRAGPGNNCDELPLAAEMFWVEGGPRP